MDFPKIFIEVDFFLQKIICPKTLENTVDIHIYTTKQGETPTFGQAEVVFQNCKLPSQDELTQIKQWPEGWML